MWEDMYKQYKTVHKTVTLVDFSEISLWSLRKQKNSQYAQGDHTNGNR